MGKSFQDKISDVLKNEQLLKNIRTGILLSLSLVLPLTYFGYADSLTIDKLFKFSFGGLVLLVWFSLQLASKESKLRAFDDKFVSDDELINSKKTIEANKKVIVSKDKSLKRTTKFMSSYNREQQDLYNEILTNDKVYDLEQKERDYRLDGKISKANVIEKEIKRLRENPIVDKAFEKYDVKLIANYNTSKMRRKKSKGNAEINVDPKKSSKSMAFISLTVKSVGIGVFGSIPLVFEESLWTILAFYLMYVLTLTLTIVVNYIVTTYIMNNVYKPSLKRIIDIQELLIEHLDKPQVEEAVEPINEADEVWFSHIKKLELAK